MSSSQAVRAPYRAVDRKCICVTKRTEIVSSANGKRVFFVGEPFVVAPDQYEFFIEHHREHVLNLTPKLVTPIEALVLALFPESED